MPWLLRKLSTQGAKLLAILLALVSAVPFLLAHYPQMTDYPAHLARYHVMLNGSDPSLARNYAFHWAWSGNLGVDILMLAVGPLLGVEAAARLIVGTIPLITAAGIFRVEWTLRGRIGAGSVLALPAIWSPALLLGFTNFALSLGLALLAFSWWISTSAVRWRWVVFLPIGLAVFLCHQSGWGVLGLCVFGYELAIKRRLFQSAIATWPLWLPAAMLPFLGHGSEGLFDYGPNLVTWKLDIWLRSLAAYYPGQDLLTALLMLGSILVAAAMRRLDARMGLGALLITLMTVLVPRHLGGGDFADLRLTTVALMVGCMAIDLPIPAIAVVPCSFPFLLRVFTISSMWAHDSARMDQALADLAAIPVGAKITAAVLQSTNGWQIPNWDHIAGYATVRRNALTNADFAIRGIHMLSLRDPQARHDPAQRLPDPRGSHPDIAAFAAQQPADYLWYIGDQSPRSTPPGAVVVHRTTTTQLFKLRPVAAVDPRSPQSSKAMSSALPLHAPVGQAAKI